MPRTRPLAGITLTTAIQTIAENPAASNEIRHLELVFVNIDGGASANLTVCRRAGTTGTRQILPVNYPVRVGETVSRIVILSPGDRVEGSASAAGDIDVDAQQVYAEPNV